MYLFSINLAFTKGNELTRCCSGGARHFLQHSKCSQIRTEGSKVSCRRAASICCLRALLDRSCEQGTKMAQGGSCATTLRMVGEGIRKVLVCLS